MLAVDSQAGWMQIPYPPGTGVPVVHTTSHLPPPPPISGDGSIMQTDLKPIYSTSSQISPINSQMHHMSGIQQQVVGSVSAGSKSSQEQRVKRPMNAFMVCSCFITSVDTIPTIPHFHKVPRGWELELIPIN